MYKSFYDVLRKKCCGIIAKVLDLEQYIVGNKKTLRRLSRITNWNYCISALFKFIQRHLCFEFFFNLLSYIVGAYYLYVRQIGH